MDWVYVIVFLFEIYISFRVLNLCIQIESLHVNLIFDNALVLIFFRFLLSFLKLALELLSGHIGQ